MKLSKTSKMASAVLFALGLTAALHAHADGDKSPAEAANDYRSASMSMVGHHMGPMAAMAKGKMDFDLDVFTKNAEAMATLSKLTANGYDVAPEEGMETHSKPEIWENKEDFTAKHDDFSKAAEALVEATKSGDKDLIMPKFKELGKSCKACHKEYKKKDD